ncbi:asparagine--tRNA ligase [Candidatus Mycoplasma haematominutum]|uniref:asparagine--tRNA ligase n=1 Tax=Candidatus Mycoplasma haematominutum TaxID=209446 RepID=UPI0002DDF2E0|nr:asparagine--tRNA ligase [Candidatus Mycoplasma haematominutum]
MEVKGWIKSMQEFNSIIFLVINDGSDISGLQVILKPEQCKSIELSPGSAVSICGTLEMSRGGKQKLELRAQEITLLKKVGENFPLLPLKLSLDYLRTQQLVRHRTTIFHAVYEIRRELIQTIFSFFYKNHFFPVMAPILSPNSCEGGAELFSLSREDSNFFNKDEVLLSVSGQFYCETISLGLKNSFSFGPTFRAEKSNSLTHLAEFWMIEAEMAFTSLTQIIAFTYTFFKTLVSSVIHNCHVAITELSKRVGDKDNLMDYLKALISKNYKIITYSEGIELISKNKSIKWGDNLSREDENMLCQLTGSKILFITEFPVTQKPFYMKRDPAGIFTYSFDMLVENIGEIAGGSERESSLPKLEENIKSSGLNKKELEWYLKLREFGYHSSSGFGMGFERLLMLLTGLKNIKDLSVFPRYYEHMQL